MSDFISLKTSASLSSWNNRWRVGSQSTAEYWYLWAVLIENVGGAGGGRGKCRLLVINCGVKTGINNRTEQQIKIRMTCDNQQNSYLSLT
jgi:hypothetical protein